MFGGCGCGRNVTGGSDYQQVVALMSYNMGYVGISPLIQSVGYPVPTNTVISNNGWGFPNTTQIPDTIYLQATVTYFDEYTGVEFGTQTTTFDIYGDYVITTTGQTPAQHAAAGGGGALTQWAVSQPYTWAACTANAVALLAQVQLLSPASVYQAFYSTNGGTEFAGPRPVNLCYASEASAFANPTQLLILAYTGPVSNGSGGGVLQMFTDGGDFIAYQQLGIPNAQNGNYVIAGYDPGITGYCIASKCAVRSPTAFLSETISLFTLGLNNIIFDGLYIDNCPITGPVVLTQPLNPPMPPGEYIFTPGEVGGFGYVLYNGSAAPNLPGAKPTADTTTTTTDTTTTTADSQ